MDCFGKYWITFLIIIITYLVVILAANITYVSLKQSELYYKAFDKCMDQKGEWNIDRNMYRGTCIFK